ncbi:hypothetical protein [Sandaracinobacteroides saxicola]|uniref:Uncharacterized protein n=1 Tax=Sandaracinobacteroides saxicola TaxID=2759707 RepID=A0A7G5IJQ1_9SPHN|nr:hypothetical protein [Sandaracinobacteroides saxicola]QMW23593.1 hypothetical protein H3309_03610 [Sandaracinobacteroides saxicola]
MSAVEAAVRAVRDVLLLGKRIDDLEGDVTALSRDIQALAADHALLAQRVARIEGFVEGAAAANVARRARLPKA